MGTINVPWDGASVRFDGDRSLYVTREFTDDPRECTLRYFSMRPGVFTIRAIAAKGDKTTPFQRCEVTVGDLPPVPVPPGPVPPGPTPVPPTPVPPTPVPPIPPVPPGPQPIPDDPVAARLKDALKKDADPAPDKLSNCSTLSAFFTAMAAHTRAKNESGEYAVKTIGDLLSDYRAAIPTVLKPSAIPLVRRQVAAEVAAVVGDDPGKTIDPDLRDKLIKLFEFLALILKLLLP